MELLGDKNLAKSCQILPKFYCKNCNFTTSKQSNYTIHLSTRKHTKLTLGDKTVTLGDINLAGDKVCEICNKSYMSRNGLWKHKQKCIKISQDSQDIQTNGTSDKNLIMLLIKENSELKNAMMDVIKNGTHNTHNSHNKTFNLNVFLNEQCKDALNISEFVEQIKIQLSDLETTGRLGYVEGVTRIINKNLNELETNKRPIHCSDIKRETLYIKDENEWVKDGNDKELLTKAVKKIANKNIQKISEWKKVNPDCMDSESKKNDLYLKIVSNSMSGSTQEEQNTNLKKIISKVTKEVVIDKV
jgi:hypothetical protein